MAGEMSLKQAYCLAEECEKNHAATKLCLAMRAIGWSYAHEKDSPTIHECELAIEKLVHDLRNDKDFKEDGETTMQQGLLAGQRYLEDGDERIDLYLDIGNIYGGPVGDRTQAG